MYGHTVYSFLQLKIKCLHIFPLCLHHSDSYYFSSLYFSYSFICLLHSLASLANISEKCQETLAEWRLFPSSQRGHP